MPRHAPTPSSRPCREAARTAALLVTLLMLAGCTGPRGVEWDGDEARRRLPREVAAIVPPAAVLCHDEVREEEGYHLWILRQPAGAWLAFPPLKGFEQHAMPASAIEAVLRAKVPHLPRGHSPDRRCRYSHWRADDGAEVQVREVITDQGWFATVERVRP